MNKFCLLVLIHAIIHLSLIPQAFVKASQNIVIYDTTKKIHNDLIAYNEVKNQKIDYEQIDYFYNLWINTYFKKKNFELKCDNIINYLITKKNTFNTVDNKNCSIKQELKFKKTYEVCHYFENIINSSTTSRFNETIIDKDIYDSTAEYLYYVWIALSNSPLKKLIHYDFTDNVKCPIRDLFVMSLIPYSLLIAFSLIFIIVRRHYNRVLYQLKQKLPKHLDQQQLNKLEIITLSKKDIALLNANNYNKDFHELCGICRETYCPNEKIRVLYCKHFFHQECIDNWLLYYNNNCPYCKSDISKKKFL
ncbi:hypothetical protein BCR36DRAFT_348060 [Piromyces finnis]|uniref:RING-type domain-containing protein n=1 Tax=Piromyces finnis TaxID=1754191 RepID=A0A1Y1VFJ1_9FUNG|nr:hypothetical protein BCR36DRAFT_348060 [Piromyces finnis]|eukprot:ORX54875.1 hypothetical protein BCR36DRAFT_348060 [Piromyces finnis]